jgi:sec-independent protein translocase protein TatB
MFDIGWQELFLVAVITILVVGPKELPRVLNTVVGSVRKVRRLANDFQRGIDELARETELDDIRKDLERAADVNFERELEETNDLTDDLANTMQELEIELESTGVEDKSSAIMDQTAPENVVDTPSPEPSDPLKSVTSGW